jgi:hypothetical protein
MSAWQPSPTKTMGRGCVSDAVLDAVDFEGSATTPTKAVLPPAMMMMRSAKMAEQRRYEPTSSRAKPHARYACRWQVKFK